MGAHTQFLDVHDPVSCSSSSLPHHITRKCTHQRTQCVLKIFDPPATSACIEEQTELYCFCPFSIIVGCEVGDMRKVSNFGVESVEK